MDKDERVKYTNDQIATDYWLMARYTRDDINEALKKPRLNISDWG
jgi:hypothetical protein